MLILFGKYKSNYSLGPVNSCWYNGRLGSLILIGNRFRRKKNLNSSLLYSTKKWTVCHILLERRSCIYIYIYIYIYMLPHGGWALWRKELSATVSVMQGSSKELSTLVAGRVWKNVNKGCCCCLLNIKYLKIPLTNVVRL